MLLSLIELIIFGGITFWASVNLQEEEPRYNMKTLATFIVGVVGLMHFGLTSL